MIARGAIAAAHFKDLYAANFNGTDEYAYCDDPSFETDTAGTFAGWVRLATLLGGNGQKGIIGYGVRSGSNNSFWGLIQARTAATSNQNRIQRQDRIANAGTLVNNIGDTSLSATTWYHVVVSSDGSTTRIRVNNTAQTLSGTNSGNWLGDVSGTDHRLTFGGLWINNASTVFNDCRCNEWIYVGGRELTSGEITEHYNSGTPRGVRSLSFAADVDSWWRFGDRGDDGTTIYDRIGSNHLTLVNMDTSNNSTP